MAGRPKEQAVRVALERLAHEQIGDEAMPIDWVCAQLAGAATLQDLAKRIAPAAGFTPSVGWLALLLPHLAPDAKARMKEARVASGEVLVGRARRRLKKANVKSREAFQRDKELASLDMLLASRRDRENLGDTRGETNVTVNMGMLHLDALRAVQPASHQVASNSNDVPAMLPQASEQAAHEHAA